MDTLHLSEHEFGVIFVKEKIACAFSWRLLYAHRVCQRTEKYCKCFLQLKYFPTAMNKHFNMF